MVACTFGYGDDAERQRQFKAPVRQRGGDDDAAHFVGGVGQPEPKAPVRMFTIMNTAYIVEPSPIELVIAMRRSTSVETIYTARLKVCRSKASSTQREFRSLRGLPHRMPMDSSGAPVPQCRCSRFAN